MIPLNKLAQAPPPSGQLGPVPTQMVEVSPPNQWPANGTTIGHRATLSDCLLPYAPESLPLYILGDGGHLLPGHLPRQATEQCLQFSLFFGHKIRLSPSLKLGYRLTVLLDILCSLPTPAAHPRHPTACPFDFGVLNHPITCPMTVRLVTSHYRIACRRSTLPADWSQLTRLHVKQALNN